MSLFTDASIGRIDPLTHPDQEEVAEIVNRGGAAEEENLDVGSAKSVLAKVGHKSTKGRTRDAKRQRTMERSTAALLSLGAVEGEQEDDDDLPGHVEDDFERFSKRPAWLNPDSSFPPILPAFRNDDDKPLKDIRRAKAAELRAQQEEAGKSRWERMNEERSNLAFQKKEKKWYPKREGAGPGASRQQSMGHYIHQDPIQAEAREGHYAAQAQWEEGKIGVW
eukprot:NODE_2545_length_1092_cov_359.450623_g2115_i0.p2 GENE.NODE_2545_length_1092_cov_359.450623_g2115_i0~~NODE_2545_length_1092_cov_359.450623_g2115_i0.p2  ORF type:complete len:222 (-),score=63.36 NODE_2545_length_1092_cov_359.450623_g2115_i0:276-941(-)